MICGSPAEFPPTTLSVSRSTSARLSTAPGERVGRYYRLTALHLFFNQTDPVGNVDSDLWTSHRASTDDPFAELVNLGPVINSSNKEGGPALSADGLTLVFHSDRPGGQGDFDLWIATMSDSKETSPTAPPPAIAPFTPDDAKQHQKAWADYLGVPVEFENTIGLKMVLIPPGEFMMGATEEQAADMLKAAEVEAVTQGWPAWTQAWPALGITAALPQHKVRITRPFFLAAHEVTLGRFRMFVEAESYKTEAEASGKGGSGIVSDADEKPRQRPEFNWKKIGTEQTNEHPVLQRNSK